MAEPITNVLGTVAIKHCGEYDSTMHYEKLNVVTYQGSSYCAKGPTQGNLPTNTTYWDLMAEKGDKGDTGDDGYTPVKGTDYYTEADKEELEATLASDVTAEVTEQVGDLVSATPLAASSTADMTDTSRIYVNTTDGKWYYYDGTNWTAGGIYQATGINPDDSNLINMVRGAIFVIDGNVSSYSDLKNLTANRVYLYYVDKNSITNKPSDLGIVNQKHLFLVYKLSYAYNNSNYVMFLIDMSQASTVPYKNNTMYVTSANGVSNSFMWQRLSTYNNSIHYNDYIYSVTVTDTNKDLNNLEHNTMTAFYLRGNQFANAPIDMTSANMFFLNVLTFGMNDNFCSQICIDLIGNNKFYYRSYNGTNWSSWITLNNEINPDLTKINEFMEYSYLTTVLQEPIDITNKTITFAGDSITAGNFIGSTNVWAKWLCDKLETTYSNKAVGGATFAPVASRPELTQIIDQINNTTLNPVLFIAGGINDFSQEVSKSDFTTAVTSLCNWLDANYTGTVIFVTPINHVWTTITNTIPLDWYREEITRIALDHGYSVISGKELGFPLKTGDMATFLYYDGLHPSVDGQKMYANNIYRILK